MFVPRNAVNSSSVRIHATVVWVGWVGRRGRASHDAGQVVAKLVFAQVHS